jgi:hypothetical protein
MSSQGVTPPLLQVLKRTARDWRARYEVSEDGGTPRERLQKHLALPIWDLVSLISKATSIPRNDIEWVAWYSDTPLALTPTKYPAATFIPPHPELDGFLEDHATGSVLQYLHTIYEEFNKCDEDGRTAEILAHLEAKHPGLLQALELNGGQTGESTARHPGSSERGEESQASASEFVLSPTSTLPFDAQAIEAIRKAAEQSLEAALPEAPQDATGDPTAGELSVEHLVPAESKASSATPPADQPPLGSKATLPSRIEWMAKAMLLVKEKPHLSDAEIARQCGKWPGTLSRCKEYQLAAALARGQKTDLPKGHIEKDADTGKRRGIEAFIDERDEDDNDA